MRVGRSEGALTGPFTVLGA